jgi:hypothetical protein
MSTCSVRLIFEKTKRLFIDFSATSVHGILQIFNVSTHKRSFTPALRSTGASNIFISRLVPVTFSMDQGPLNTGCSCFHHETPVFSAARIFVSLRYSLYRPKPIQLATAHATSSGSISASTFPSMSVLQNAVFSSDFPAMPFSTCLIHIFLAFITLIMSGKE